MRKPRRMRRLITLMMLVMTISITGHFVADAICVVLTAVDGLECASSNGRTETTPLAADLHTTFDLPALPPSLSLIVLAFALITATSPYLPWSPAPTPPPPRTFS